MKIDIKNKVLYDHHVTYLFTFILCVGSAPLVLAPNAHPITQEQADMLRTQLNSIQQQRASERAERRIIEAPTIHVHGLSYTRTLHENESLLVSRIMLSNEMLDVIRQILIDHSCWPEGLRRYDHGLITTAIRRICRRFFEESMPLLPGAGASEFWANFTASVATNLRRGSTRPADLILESLTPDAAIRITAEIITANQRVLDRSARGIFS